MIKETNPFNIVKSDDFTNDEINKYWVDILSKDKKGFIELINPSSPMPMILLGGKGSGKSHIMRYFSYELQKIRKKNNVSDVLADNYLGIYIKCAGLNPTRFYSKEEADQEWINVFVYYFEIWLAQILVDILIDIFNDYETIKNNEKQILQHIIKLFGNIIHLSDNELTFDSLKKCLISIQKNIDFSINNYGFTNKLNNIKIEVSSKELIFGIPKLLSKYIKDFKNIQFVYLLDEFENLYEWQQQYINTLIRERELPVTFKIGVRLYGMKTYKTFSGGEENKEGSEYEAFYLDEYYRNNKQDYSKMLKQLCVTRLIQEEFITEKPDSKNLSKELKKYFERFKLEKLLKKISTKYSHRERPYLKKLIKKLEGTKHNEQIIKNLAIEDDILLEKTNIFLLYRDLKKNKDPLLSSNSIKLELKNYQKNQMTGSAQKKVLDKFKTDIVAQLHLETSEKINYEGIDLFIKMSSGIPRVFLNILKNIFRWSSFNGEDPFKSGKISLEAQRKGVMKTADWFFNDAQMAGKKGKIVKDAVTNLGTFLRTLRVADTVTECSISSFSINTAELSEEIVEIIDSCELYSLILKVSKRLDKNTKRIDPIYQLNGILVPKWDISLNRRGVVKLNKDDVEFIFNPDQKDQFQSYLNSVKNKYNIKINDETNTKKKSNQYALFNNEL